MSDNKDLALPSQATDRATEASPGAAQEAVSAIRSVSTSAWTPGPWTVRQIVADVPDVRSADGSPVARMAWLPEIGNVGVEANARLIAAAPELYGALNELISFAAVMEIMEDCPYPDALKKRRLAAQAALARARGES